MAEGRMRLAGLHPQVRELANWCLSWADYYGVPVTVTSGFRSWSDQERLWTNYQQCLATGRFGKDPDCLYPANPPGESSHNFGLSWDSWTSPQFMPWWTQVRQAAGFRVPANDLVHAEVPDWRQYV